MEIEPTENVPEKVSDKGLVSVQVNLHPLVIMNISDHWTRTKSTNDNKPQQVYGALVGRQNSRTLEIVTSFELDYKTEKDGDVVFDEVFLNEKIEMFKKVFDDVDFLGWYATGGDVTTEITSLHQKVCKWNENPLFLMLNPNAKMDANSHVKTYESILDHTTAKFNLVEVSHVLVTEEAERIGIDHVSKASNSEQEDVSAASEELRKQKSSIKMLYVRMRLLLEYSQKVHDGDFPVNHEILRRIHSLARRLPAISDDQNLQSALSQQQCDVSLIMHLTELTKSCSNVNDFIKTYNKTYSNEAISRKFKC